jgi:hypothetical protein
MTDIENIEKIKTTSRDIDYLGKDFNSFRANLIEYSKSYFPKTYKDFSENSTGMMFIEMASYVGDVLSYYIDYQFKEGFIQHAEERKNVVTLANYLGYQPKPASAAFVELEVFQLVPSVLDQETSKVVPDFRFSMNILAGMEVQSSEATPTTFRTLQAVSFMEDTKESPREVSVFQRDPDTSEPTFYLLKKKTMASAGTRKVREVMVGPAEEYYEIELIEPDVLEIVNIEDDRKNKYYQVPTLASDTIFLQDENTQKRNPFYSEYAESVPYVLKLLRTSRRFTTRVNSDNTTTIEFGQGRDKLDDEIIIPNLNNVGRVIETDRVFEVAYDPANFLKTKSYGEAPANTKLTVEYYVGGGTQSNIASNTLNTITRIEYGDSVEYLDESDRNILNQLKSSIRVNNPKPALGGRGPETTDEIRKNALSYFSAQNRAVTREDYVVRTYSMPTKFGAIAKAYVSPDGILDTRTQFEFINNLGESTSKLSNTGLTNAYGEINNPYAINLYVLSYDKNKNLVSPNELVYKNLRTYLNQYKLLTDGINITDAFVVNIGIEIEIAVFKTYNKIEVLDEVISDVKSYFNIDKWSIGQSIELSELELEISKVRGVKSAVNVRIYNKTINDGNYSDNEYNLESATYNKVIYPSVDPCIFELKFPDRDVVGRVVE